MKMAQEGETPYSSSSLEPRPSVRRRPTDHELAVRPHLSRKPSDLLPPPMVQGQFTPELSPLDAFVSRGRQMYRDLQIDKGRANSEQSHTALPLKAELLNQNHFHGGTVADQQQKPLPQQPPPQQQRPPHPLQTSINLAPPTPTFNRSHSSDGTTGVTEAQSLSKAVENWTVGQSLNHRGNPRETKLFTHSAGRQAHPSASSTPSAYPKQPHPGYSNRSGGGGGAGAGANGPLPNRGPQSIGVMRIAPPQNMGMGMGMGLSSQGHNLSLHEPTNRPVSQHPRISGIEYPDDALSPTLVAPRAFSGNHSNGSSPRSPRMPTFGDDSDDESSFTMSIHSRNNISRSTTTEDPSTRGRPAPSPDFDQLSPRTQAPPGHPPYPIRQSSMDSQNSTHSTRSAHSQLSQHSHRSRGAQREPTPPYSTSPTSYSRPLDLKTPTQPNFPQQQYSRSYENDTIRQNEPLTPVDGPVLYGGELFLPPQPAFAARSAPSSPRPPSAMSDHGSIYSVGGTKKAMNFSRPMSKQSFYAADMEELRKNTNDIAPPRRQLSSDPDTDTDNERHSPMERPNALKNLTHLEQRGHRYQGSGSGKAGPTEQYTYSQYALPRGRTVQRDSVIMFGERHRFPSASREKPEGIEEGRPSMEQTPRPSTDHQQHHQHQQLQPQPQPQPQQQQQIQQLQLHQPQPQKQQMLIMMPPPRPSVDIAADVALPTTPKSPWMNIPLPRKSMDNLRPSMDNGNRPPMPGKRHSSTSPTRSSGVTATATTPTTPTTPSINNSQRPVTSGGAHILTPAQHLDIAIPLHEKGSYAESTYHLRLAALGGNTTGMLLYALALRHGWGMRPSQAEGVAWLRKAANLAQAEIAAANADPSKPKPDWWESKNQRARFALSIYELGVSHMNGWGTDVDKALALSCYEIAGTWGDSDALQEAGFCYANAVGCKKDLKKSAKFYRMAEEKSVSMIGQSWIWKDKYLDDEDRKKLSGRKDSKSAKDKKDKDKEKDGKKKKKGSW